MTRDRPSAPKRRSSRAEWRAAELVALDFETTGLDLDRDEVISFGLIPVRDGRRGDVLAATTESAPVPDPVGRRGAGRSGLCLRRPRGGGGEVRGAGRARAPGPGRGQRDGGAEPGGRERPTRSRPPGTAPPS